MDVPNFPRAACYGRGHLFDPRAPGEAPNTPRGRTIPRHQQAQRICRDECPHHDECRIWGLENHHDRDGERPVIGGLTFQQRQQIRAKDGLPNPERIGFWKIYECGHPDGPHKNGRCVQCVRAYEEQRNHDAWVAGIRKPRPQRRKAS